MLIFYLSALETEDEKRTISHIYESNKRLMKVMALKVLSGDDAAAEDAVHSAFIAIIENKEKFFSLPDVDMGRLCVTIVRNKAIDILRKGKRLADTPIEDMYNLESGGPAVEHHAEVMQDYEQMIKLINRLDEDSKTIIIMRLVHNLSYKEISTMTNIPIRTVETKLYRARGYIRKNLKQENIIYG